MRSGTTIRSRYAFAGRTAVGSSVYQTPRLFAESLEETLSYGVEGVIMTGDWTRHAPPVKLCAEAKRHTGHRAAALTGSSMTAENAASFIPHIDGCIVGTTFKAGVVDTKRRIGPNLVDASVRYNVEKVKKFVAAVRHAEEIV